MKDRKKKRKRGRGRERKEWEGRKGKREGGKEEISRPVEKTRGAL